MALAPINKPHSGRFNEVEFGKRFDFYKLETPMVDCGGNVFEYLFYAGPEGNEIRYCNLKKTRAYVATDIDSNGNFIVETWKIKNKVEWGTTTI